VEAKKFYTLVVRQVVDQMTNKYMAQSARIIKLISKDAALAVKKAVHTIVGCIDGAVYSSIQNFRLLGNTKSGEKRFKKKVESIKYLNSKLVFKKEKMFRNQMTESLISFVAGCNYVLGLAEVKERIIRDGLDLDGKIDEIKNLFNEKYQRIFHSIKPPFVMTSFSDGIINYRRVMACFCPLCSRSHQNENCYLTVSGGTLNVYYHCFRADNDFTVKNKSVLLGTLSGGTSKDFEDDFDKFLVQLVRKAIKKNKIVRKTIIDGDSVVIETEIDSKDKINIGKAEIKTVGDSPDKVESKSVGLVSEKSSESDKGYSTSNSDTSESDEIIIYGKAKVRNRHRRTRSEIMNKRRINRILS
jgi:hypothetical protein